MAHDPFSPSLESPVSSLLVRDVAGSYRPAEPAEVLQAALRVLAGQLRGSEVLSSPQMVRDFLRIKLGTLEHEVFAVIHLDAQHQVIEYVEMFRGTVSQTSVYPREIVKESLARNSAALILAHFVARHKMRLLCPVFLCAVLGGQERTSWASGQNRGT